MRLIDADKLKTSFDMPKEYDEFAYHVSLPIIKATIDDALTVDAVPVVRCKDCKYMTEHYDTDGSVPYWTCSEWDAGTDYDGYCHYGERRENADN